MAYYICEALGTHLPNPSNFDQVAVIFDLAKKSWENYTDEKFKEPPTGFWTPINDIRDEGSFILHYDNTKASKTLWKKGEPNGLVYENCGQFETKGIFDISCEESRCAACEMTELKIFSLIGTCETYVKNRYFIAYQENIGDLIFKGYAEYHIRKEGFLWKWVNVITNKTMAEMDPFSYLNMPIGRRTWVLKQDVCGQKQGGTRQLLLTRCNTTEFTCDDGTCIPHDYLCDLKFDCLDSSDERSCEKVRIPDDYQMELPPRNYVDDVSPLPILLLIDIESLNIDTSNMIMEGSWELTQIWYDMRVDFKNLKVNDSYNQLTNSEIKKLWIPVSDFVNTKDFQQTQVDGKVKMFALRRAHYIQKDDSYPSNG